MKTTKLVVCFVLVLASIHFLVAEQPETEVDEDVPMEESELKKNVNNNVNVTNNLKQIKVKNNEETNVKVKEKNKFNSQLAQIVVNVPKQKVLRKSRYPTTEEYRVQEAIKLLYKKVKKLLKTENTRSVRKLDEVINALNPKYVATERIWKILFTQPWLRNDMPPLPDFSKELEPLKLDADKPIGEQLDSVRDEVVKRRIDWGLAFMEKLANTSDRELEPEQVAIKRMLLCLGNHYFCPKTVSAKREASNKLASKGVTHILGYDPTKAKPKSDKVATLVDEVDNQMNYDSHDKTTQDQTVKKTKKVSKSKKQQPANVAMLT